MTVRRDWTAARDKVEAEGQCRVGGDRGSGCIGPLEAAHVIARNKDEDVDPIDVVPLCRYHHQQYDARRISLLGVLTYEEQAAAVAKLGIYRAVRRITGGSEDIV